MVRVLLGRGGSAIMVGAEVLTVILIFNASCSVATRGGNPRYEEASDMRGGNQATMSQCGDVDRQMFCDDLATAADLSPQPDLMRGAPDQADSPDLLPAMQLPDLQMPDLQMPDLQMPDLQMPDMKTSDGGMCMGPMLQEACVSDGKPGPHCCLPMTCTVVSCAGNGMGGFTCLQLCRLINGQPCTQDDECQANRCTMGTCG